jgi:nucleoside-triphosphatase
MVTQEVRTGGHRVGFRIRNLASGREGCLARVEGSTGPRIGKYTVDTHDLETVGVEAIRNAIEGRSRLVLVDEVGPMEMTSTVFRGTISRLLHASKPTVATVKYGSRYQEVEEASGMSGPTMITITPENRDKVVTQIIAHLDTWVGESGD